MQVYDILYIHTKLKWAFYYGHNFLLSSSIRVWIETSGDCPLERFKKKCIFSWFFLDLFLYLVWSGLWPVTCVFFYRCLFFSIHWIRSFGGKGSTLWGRSRTGRIKLEPNPKPKQTKQTKTKSGQVHPVFLNKDTSTDKPNSMNHWMDQSISDTLTDLFLNTRIKVSNNPIPINIWT